MKTQIDYTGELFLDRLFKDLYKSPEVLNGNQSPSQKKENIKRYMNRLSELHKRVNESKRENDKNLLKQLYYKKYVIKESEIPNSYYKHQQRILLERGFGHVNLTYEKRKELSNQVIEEQKKSLSLWIDYFLSNDTNMYPIWIKYWAFQGMLKLGVFDKEKKEFSRRTSGTISPFVELNREALALSIDMLLKYLNHQEIEEKNLEKIIASGVFGRIYAYQLTRLEEANKRNSKDNEGIWVKYQQGSNPQLLVKTLEGKGTGWCTVGITTAKHQLKLGDFYIFYSYDSNNEATIPRIAIRMEGTEIAEIRGIGKEQNVEPEMEKILEQKLEEFPYKNEYKQKVEDMKKLTKIYQEYQKRNLEEEELKFLYEVNQEIKGFGYQKDPRIEEIQKTRNVRKDLVSLFKCNEDEIGFNINDIYSRKIVYYYGDLNLSNLETAENVNLPQIICGSLDLSGLTTTKGLNLPKTIRGTLSLDNLKTAENIKFPEKIGKNFDLTNLEIAKNLILPKYIGGNLYLDCLTTVENLIFPQIIDGSLNLDSLNTLKGLNLPEKIGENLYLESLMYLAGVKLPDNIGGDIWLNSLIEAKGLNLPKKVKGSLSLKSLRTIENLNLPEIIEGYLDLSGLKTLEGLELPKNIRGALYLENLKDISTLVLPPNFICEFIKIDDFYIYPCDYYKFQKDNGLMKENSSKENK